MASNPLLPSSRVKGGRIACHCPSRRPHGVAVLKNDHRLHPLQTLMFPHSFALLQELTGTAGAFRQPLLAGTRSANGSVVRARSRRDSGSITGIMRLRPTRTTMRAAHSPVRLAPCGDSESTPRRSSSSARVGSSEAHPIITLNFVNSYTSNRRATRALDSRSRYPSQSHQPLCRGPPHDIHA